MKRVIILTGSEPRHTFLRKAIAASGSCEVVRSYCEGLEHSLEARLERSQTSAQSHQSTHVAARAQSEADFFGLFNRYCADASHPVFLPKGAINDTEHTNALINLSPDLLAAFGCSLIKQPLIEAFPRLFVNVHLGLSPYYRGSGTNFFPLVDGRPEFVGATFMHIDSGIDTGEIIHQIRARVFRGDRPHQIGNRLIGDVVAVYAALLEQFDDLEPMPQPDAPPSTRMCKRDDFTEDATTRLYEQFENGLVERYLAEEAQRCFAVPLVSHPKLVGITL